MLSLLSSSYISLRLTQIAYAYIVLNTSCKKLDYKFAECVIVMLSLGYHLRQSQKRAFLFSVKRFCRFQGVQPAPDRVRHVPFWGILVFRKKLLPKSGLKTPPKRPKPAQNGPKRSKQAQPGPKRPKNGMCMSLFWTFLFLEKDFCQNQDMQHYVRFS